MFITDPWTIEDVKARRAESGADRHDEVWDGVYVVSPLVNNDHQRLISRFMAMFQEVVAEDGLGEAFPGVNVSDRTRGWKLNHRQPDLAVFLNGTKARDKGTHWLGGPDFAVEILSPNDRAYEKLDFYAKVCVRELLIVDRDPWRVELYRLSRGKLALVGESARAAGKALASKILPLTFRLVVGKPRPTIAVVHVDGRHWEI